MCLVVFFIPVQKSDQTTTEYYAGSIYVRAKFDQILLIQRRQWQEVIKENFVLW